MHLLCGVNTSGNKRRFQDSRTVVLRQMDIQLQKNEVGPVCTSLFSCVWLCHPINCSMPGFPVLHYLLEFAQNWTFVELVIFCNHHILCCSLLLLPSVFPSIRVFSIELVLPIRWPRYWSFSFTIIPSSEYSGLISFLIDWFHLLAVQRTLKSLLQNHN